MVQGGIDCLIKYRYHWCRNIFALFACSEIILGIVGLSIGDGEGDKLVDTLNYHSAFVMIYVGIECTITVCVHYFLVVFEELSWKYPNHSVSNPTSSSSPSTVFPNESMASKTNKVACDGDLRCSSKSIPADETIARASLEDQSMKTEATFNGSNLHETLLNNDVENFLLENGKEDGNLEEEAAAHGFVSPSATFAVTNSSNSALTPIQSGGMIVPYESHQRRFALAFDGISRRASALSKNIVTHQIMRVKLKRHELACIEFDKLICVTYQMMLWELVLWLAQLFLGLYLQSVNTPIPTGQNGYYCQTPLENTVNSVQFVNDFVFARR